MTFELGHASYSLPEWQAVKLTFFAPWLKDTFNFFGWGGVGILTADLLLWKDGTTLQCVKKVVANSPGLSVSEFCC